MRIKSGRSSKGRMTVKLFGNILMGYAKGNVKHKCVGVTVSYGLMTFCYTGNLSDDHRVCTAVKLGLSTVMRDEKAIVSAI
eukprot:6199743-Pleurochrysis_carterae.AAC.1